MNRGGKKFIIGVLAFFAIILFAVLISNLPLSGFAVGENRLIPPITVDVCNQSFPHNVFGTTESNGCNRTVGRNDDYYYYGTVHSGYGTYLPYWEPRPITN